MMLDALLTELETDLHAALSFCVTDIVATVRTQLACALAEVDKERANGLAEMAELRAKAVQYVGAKHAELQRELEAMQAHKEQHEGRVELNVGGYRYETSVQTLQSVPGNLFDTCFSCRYEQDVCADLSRPRRHALRARP